MTNIRVRKIYLAIFFAVITIIAASCGPNGEGGGTSVSPATTTSLSADFNPDSGSSSGTVSLQKMSVTNDIVYLNIDIDNIYDVYGASIKLDYDSSKVKWVNTESHQDGNFLEKSVGQPFYAVALDGQAGEGRLVIGVSLLASETTVGGSGTLITIPFRVISKGSTSISLDSSILLDSTGEQISVSSWNGGTILGS